MMLQRHYRFLLDPFSILEIREKSRGFFYHRETE